MITDLQAAVAEGGHPAPEALQRFITGQLPPAEVRGLVLHLLKGCPACTSETRRLWGLGTRPAGSARRRVSA